MNGGRHIAILIGASEFPQEPSLPSLRCPQRDVEGLAAALTAQEIGLFDETLTFINQPHHTVLRAINRVFTQAARLDQILIYYSGHGKQDSAGSLHLATVDTEVDALETTSIAVDSFRRLIDNYACKKVALILDCCFGGAAGKDFLKGSVGDQLRQVSAGRGIYILTASTATQTAREKEGDEYSLLTKHILHGLTRGEADQDDDGLVSLDDLYEYVRARVSHEAPQHPMKWALGVQGGEFVIARAVKSYSPERLRAFREMIKSLDSYLPDDVFDQAIQVIRAKRPKQDKEFLLLIEALSEGRVNVGEFISRWFGLGLPFSVQQQRELAAQRQRELEEQRRKEEQLAEEQSRKEERRRTEEQIAEAARQVEEQRQKEAQRQDDKRYPFESHDPRSIHPQNSTAIPARNHAVSTTASGAELAPRDGQSRRNFFIVAGLIALVIGGLAVGLTAYIKQQALAARQRVEKQMRIENLNQKKERIGSLRERIAELNKRLQTSDKPSFAKKKHDIGESLYKLSQRLDNIAKMSPDQLNEISQACDEIGKALSKIEEEVNSLQ